MAGSQFGTGAGTETTASDAVDGPRIGQVIDGRYRLDAPAGNPAGALWRATDLVLARTVAVRLRYAEPAARAAFLAAASATCKIADPTVAATYDAAPFGEAGQDGAYVVREWVEGQSLEGMLTDGPLPPARATALLRQLALAVAHLHEAGLAHGHVHPGNVLIRTDDQVRLTDAGLDTPAGPAADLSTTMRADVVSLGRTLYAALTARWPAGPWRGLEAAPRNKAELDRPLTARQVRAGVSRELDALVSAILDLDPQDNTPPLASAAQIAAALAGLPIVEDDLTTQTAVLEPVPGLPRRPMTRRRRRGLWGAVLAGVAVIGLIVAAVLGATYGGSPSVPAFTPPSTSAGASPGPPIAFGSVQSFDPPPGDGVENPSRLAAVNDGNPTTAWQTETYATAALGNAKPGVGLLIDIGTARAVSEVRISFQQPGTDFDVLAMSPNASAAGTALADFTLVARRQNADATMTVPVNKTSRFWLVWLTKLPAVDNGSGYRAGINEITLLS